MSQQKAEFISQDFCSSKQIPIQQPLSRLMIELDGYVGLVQEYNWTGSSSSRCKKKLLPSYTWPKPLCLHLFQYVEHGVVFLTLFLILASNFIFTENESSFYVYCGSNLIYSYYVLSVQTFLTVLLKWVSSLLKNILIRLLSKLLYHSLLIHNLHVCTKPTHQK